MAVTHGRILRNALLIVVALAACGSATAQTFTPIAPLHFTMQTGQSNPLPQVLTITSTGADFSYNSPSAQTVSGGSWLQVSSGCPSGTTPSACVVRVSGTSLAPGVYTGQVNLVRFSNGVTVSVPVTLTVVAPAAAFPDGVPGALTFVAGNGSIPVPQSFQVVAAGGPGQLNWSATVATTGGNWLSVSAATGTTPSNVTVSVTTAGLAAGIYIGEVLFQSSSGSVSVPVSLEVTSATTAVFQQMPALKFVMVSGGTNPLPQVLEVASTGVDFSYTAPTTQTSSGGAWLQLIGCNSETTPSSCRVWIDATTLPAGTYSGQVIFRRFSNDRMAVVPVTLTVKAAGEAFFGSAPGALHFVAGNGFSPRPQTIQIVNGGGGTLAWTVAANVLRTDAAGSLNWLSVSSASGTGPAELSVGVSPDGLAAGTYLGQVAINSGGATVTVPIRLIVLGSGGTTLAQLPGLNFSMTSGGSNPLPQVLPITSTFTQFRYSSPTSQTASGGNWLQLSGCSSDDTPSTCTVSVSASTLPAGSYSGQVLVRRFSDDRDLLVPVTLVIRSPSEPSFGGLPGGLNFVSGNGFYPPAQSIRITNAGSGSLAWTATTSILNSNPSGSINWLTISSSSGTAPSTVSIGVSPAGLQPGNYLGRVNFQSATGSVTVPVSLVVLNTGEAQLAPLPGLSFTMTAGGSNPLPQLLTPMTTAANFSLTTPTAQTSSGGNWLQLANCSSGSTPSTCRVAISGSTLAAGTYIGQVIVRQFANYSAIVVPVTLTVKNPAEPCFGGLPGGLNFVTGNGHLAPARTIRILNACGGSLNWTATVSAIRGTAAAPPSWLTISASSGTAPSSLTIAVTPDGLSPGTYLGQVLLQTPDASVSIPVTLEVLTNTTATFQQMPGLNFTMTAGGPNPLSQLLTMVSTAGDFYLTDAVAQTASGGDWLKIPGCDGGITPTSCMVSVDGGTLAAGTYIGHILVRDFYVNLVVPVPVTLTVVSPAAPSFAGMIGGLNFVANTGQTPAAQTVQIPSAGFGALAWTASTTITRTNAAGTANWLTISANSGGSPSAITVNASTAGLGPGWYQGQILFQSATGSVSVPVTLVVLSVDDVVFKQPPAISFAMAPGSTVPAAQTATIESTVQSIRISSAYSETSTGGAWLKLTGCSGTSSCYTPQGYSVSLNAAASALPSGLYVGQAVFHNYGSRDTTLTAIVPITLTVGTPTSCGFTTGANSSGSINQVGGVLTASFTASATNCGWTASTTAPWITFGSPVAGSGNGSVILIVAPNFGLTSRSGTVNIGNTTYTVNQSAASCTYGLSSSVLNTSANGQTGTINLTAAGSNCAWASQPDASWVQIFPSSGGAGTTVANYTIFPNFAPRSRSTTLRMGTATITINQTASTLTVNERFVSLVYFSFLGRLPAAAELAFQVQALTAGATRPALAMNFFNSLEFNLAGRFVAGLYVGLLNRDAEYNGWLFQRNAYATSVIDQNTAVSNFLNSAEFQVQNPGLGNDNFVRLLYRQVLLREAGPAEVTFQSSALAGGITRTQLASNFLNSTEFRTGTGPRLTTALLYFCLLQRDLTAGERTAMVAQLTGGTPVQDLVSGIVASSEFLAAIN